MAPVNSKMASPDHQSPSRHLALTLPTRSRPLTINQLTDDSLIILLSLLPLVHLLDTVPFTCKRWHALLPLVFHQRHSLVLHGFQSDFEILNEPFLFQTKRQIKSEAYAAYLTALFQPRSNKPPNRSPTFLGVFNQRNSLPIHHRHQLVKLSLCKFLTSHFRHLTHLSLLCVQFKLEPLLSLLATYRESLQSLAIKGLTFPDQPYDAHYPGNQDTSYTSLWPLLNTMTTLNHLSLDCLRFTASNLAPVLTSLLPRLASLTLENYLLTPIAIGALLDQLDERKLTQLNLCNLGTWRFSGHLGSSLLDFFNDRPTFGSSLTSLTLILTSGNLPLALFQTIVNRCTRLRHLGFSLIETLRFDSLLPYLVKLPHLTSLRLRSHNRDLFQASPEGLRPLPLPCLTSLRTLTLETLIITQTFAILPKVAPNLRQLHLDRAFLRVDRGNSRLAGVNPKYNSTHLAALIEILNSFAFLPKIEFPSKL